MAILKRYTFPDGSVRNLSEEQAVLMGFDPKDGRDRKGFSTRSEVSVAGKTPNSQTGIVAPKRQVQSSGEGSMSLKSDVEEEVEVEEEVIDPEVEDDVEEEVEVEETPDEKEPETKSKTPADVPNKRRTRSRNK